MKFIQSFLQYGNQKSQTYINEDTGNHIHANRFEEWGVIRLSNIKANEEREVILMDHGIESPISLKSLYVFAKDSNNDEIKSFKIKQLLENNQKVDIGEMKLEYNQIPYRFPDGAILMPDNIISLRPAKVIDNIYIYFKPVSIIHYDHISGQTNNASS